MPALGVAFAAPLLKRLPGIRAVFITPAIVIASAETFRCVRLHDGRGEDVVLYPSSRTVWQDAQRLDIETATTEA